MQQQLWTTHHQPTETNTANNQASKNNQEQQAINDNRSISIAYVLMIFLQYISIASLFNALDDPTWPAKCLDPTMSPHVSSECPQLHVRPLQPQPLMTSFTKSMTGCQWSWPMVSLLMLTLDQWLARWWLPLAIGNGHCRMVNNCSVCLFWASNFE